MKTGWLVPEMQTVGFAKQQKTKEIPTFIWL